VVLGLRQSMRCPHFFTLAFVALVACASAPPLPPLAPAGPQVSAETPVMVYGTRWCQHTRAALDYFRAHNIASRFRDVEQDPDAWEEMNSRLRAAHLNANNVIPILSVRERVLVGYHQEEVERALQD
jgi:arsenate reductase-like glutaredoxin family protein